jgi:hypothetical protein
MGDTVSFDEFKAEMLGIIDTRLTEIEKEITALKNRSNKDKYVYRWIQWHEQTRETNLKWKAVLQRGRFARI